MTTPPDRAEEGERERAAFEAWARSAMCMEPFLAMRLSDGSRYESLQIEGAWQAWLARARSGDAKYQWLRERIGKIKPLKSWAKPGMVYCPYCYADVTNTEKQHFAHCLIACSDADIDAAMALSATPARGAGDGP